MSLSQKQKISDQSQTPTSDRFVQEVVFKGGASLCVKQALVNAGGCEDLLIGQLH